MDKAQAGLECRLGSEIDQRIGAAGRGGDLAGIRRVHTGEHLDQRRLSGSIAADKGSAIAAYMTEPPFLGRRPVFLGDDTTDEDGFATVNRMNGHSICVGLSLRTGANWRIPRPFLVRAWLAALAGALETGRAMTELRA